MRIYISTKPDASIGGGWTFTRNIVNYLNQQGAMCVFDKDMDFDVAFVIGPTTISKEDFRAIRSNGKPIVLRIDNIPEDYRNRGTALSRLKEFSQGADVVIYQSEWARKYVRAFTGIDGTVIMNGVDRTIFNTKGRVNREVLQQRNYLYIRSSTNESKRWQEAKYIYRQEFLNYGNTHLNIVGNFGDYLKQYGDDFIKNYKMGMFDEPYTYLGQITDPNHLAEIYKRSHYVIAPFYNDACSNVMLEARACGCELMMGTAANTGANQEILALPDDKMSIEYMGEQYLGIFKVLATGI